MSPLANRILEQLTRRSITARAVQLIFGVTEEEATVAVAELLKSEQAYRHGTSLIATNPAAHAGTAPTPAGPQRQVEAPAPSTPRPKPPAPAPAPAAVPARSIVTAAAVPPVTQEPSTMASEKVCTGECGESKAATTEFFYKAPGCQDGLTGQCKVCIGNRAKKLKKDRAKGSAPAAAKAGKRKAIIVAKPKRAAPAPRPSSPIVDGESMCDELAILHTPSGFRLGPLHKTIGGLVQMPYHIDLSFDQVDELTAMRKAVAA